MKKSTLFIILLIGGVVLVNYFSKRKDSGTGGPPSVAERPSKQPPADPGIWPPPDPEGKPVTLAPNYTAKNYYIIFDGSGSMDDSHCADGSTKILVAKKAVADFAKSIPEDANLGLLAFDLQGISERLPLGTGNREPFIEAVNAVDPGDATPLKSAIRLGVDRLTAQARQQLGYGEYHLVVVTDGEANPDGENPSAAVDWTLKTSPILIHTIGFCIGEAHSLNQPGRTIYHAANNPDDLTSGLKEVLAESESFDVKAFQ